MVSIRFSTKMKHKYRIRAHVALKRSSHKHTHTPSIFSAKLAVENDQYQKFPFEIFIIIIFSHSPSVNEEFDMRVRLSVVRFENCIWWHRQQKMFLSFAGALATQWIIDENTKIYFVPNIQYNGNEEREKRVRASHLNVAGCSIKRIESAENRMVAWWPSQPFHCL